ncbi:MAG: hypothetical protein ACFFCL_14520 [Promethearchaeota archaeon]
MNYIRGIILILFIILIWPVVVYAYIDSGTGSYVLQVILAFFLGGVITFRSHYNKIISFLKRIFYFRRK